MQYRFPEWKDASWNSFKRQSERYEVIRPFLGTNCVAAELGVYKGGFGEFLLPHCRKLYLVDVWYRARGFWNSGIAADSRVDTVIDILRTYKTEIEQGRVEVVIDLASRFLESLPERVLDFVYLDASHDYNSTRHELAVALTRVVPGGYLFGDDYDPDPASKQHGVFRAVNELRDLLGTDLVIDHSRQWGLRAPENLSAVIP